MSMPPTTFAEVHNLLRQGDHVNTARLKAWTDQANELANFLFEIPEYRLVAIDLLRTVYSALSAIAFRESHPA